MRIVALKQRLATVVENMDGMLAAAATEDNRDLTAEEIGKFDAFKAEADKLEADIAREQDVLNRKAIAAQPVGTVPGTAAPVANTVPAAPAGEKGIMFARMTRALAVARGNPFHAREVAESWGDSGLFANQNMGSGAAGGFLVPEAVASEMIELLRPASVVMASSPIVMPMVNGNMTMNRQATGVTATYVGEQQASNATGVTFGQVKLSAKKLQALVPISNDLLRSASLAADRVVRDDLILSLATRTDLAFIRGSGTAFSPRGLRFQLTGTAQETANVLTMTASPSLVTITSDLGRLELAHMNADVTPIRPTWLMAPRTLMHLTNLRDGNGNLAFPEIGLGELRGKPFRVTTQIPTNLGAGTETELYLVDFGHIVVGEHMGVEIAMSTEASYLNASGTLVSAFAQDETLMRAIQQHDIGARHLAAIAVLTGVTWGA
jgi:HK97 family phage major capsid protein